MKKFLLLLAVSYIPGEGVGDRLHGTVVKGLFARMSSGRRFYEFQRYDFTIIRLTILRLSDMICANFQFKR